MKVPTVRPSFEKWARFSLESCWTWFPARAKCLRSTGRPAVSISVSRLLLKSRCSRAFGRLVVSKLSRRLPAMVSLLTLWYEVMLFVEASETRSKLTNWGKESDVISFEKLIIVFFLV